MSHTDHSDFDYDSETQSDFFTKELTNLAYAHGKPELIGTIKAKPEHFRVTEVLDIELLGEGEHFWLDITKVGLSTDRVAKELARFAGVAYRDVGYAGMKDVQAVTRQWFSVWMPKQLDFDWSGFTVAGVVVHTIVKHQRKLKRGAHRGNRFELVLTNLSNSSDHLMERLERIRDHGLPNYFGDQRFGRQANNLLSAMQLFSGKKKIKDRNLKSIVLSAARSFLFNLIVSERVRSGSWVTLYKNEPAALDGSNAIFSSQGETDNESRITALDIHTTAPLWGRAHDRAREDYADLFAFELQVLAATGSVTADFMSGLERFGLEYQRRALRMAPKDMAWEFQAHSLMISFTLQPGQFATSVLRELIQVSD